MLRGHEAAPDPSTYFSNHRNDLKPPSAALKKSFEIGLNSWETPSSFGGSKSGLEFFVGLKNKDTRRTVVVADVIVEPTVATAPGVRVSKDRFVIAKVPAGAQRQLEIAGRSLEDPSRRPTESQDQFKPGDYGINVFAVAAFQDEVPKSWRTMEKPGRRGEFKQIWEDFSWVTVFSEIPPDVFFLAPPRQATPSPRQTTPSPGKSP